MKILKIKEAMMIAKSRGEKVSCADLANEMWDNGDGHSANNNFSNLVGGRTKKIDIAFVPYLCKRLGVSADFLFGLTDIPNYNSQEEDKELMRKKIEKNVGLINKKLENIVEAIKTL